MGLADSLRAYLTKSGYHSRYKHKRTLRDISKKRLALAVHHAIEPLEIRTLLTATPLYWDPSAAATASGGSGTWDTATAEWRAGSPTGSLVAWSNSGDSNGAFAAVFPAPSGTVALGTSVTVQSISFAGTYYDLTTSNSSVLTFSGGNGQVDVAASSTAMVEVNVSASNGLTKTSAGTLMLTGNVTDSASAVLDVQQGSVAASGSQSWMNVEVESSGMLILQGSGASFTASGAITVDGLFDHFGEAIQTPTLTIDSSGAFRDQAGSLGGTTGGIAVSNAGMFISVTDQSLVGATGTFDNTGTYEVDNTTGSGTTVLGLSFTNAGGTIEVTGGTLSVPSLSLPNGTLLTLDGSGTFTVPVLDDDNGSIDQVSGTFTIPQGLTFGDHFQSGATYTLAGGTLNVGALYVGNFSTASLIQTGGTLNSQHTEIGSFGNGTYAQSGGNSNFTDLYFGYFGVGQFDLSGGNCITSSFQTGYAGTATIHLSGTGSLTAGGETLGRWGGTSTFVQSGGSNNLGTGGIGIGDAAGTGNYVLSGGTLSLGFLVIGSNQNGIGTYTQTGGTATVQYNVYDGDSSGANGHLNMSGGSLSVLTFFAGAPGATGTVNLTGGTIAVSTDMIIGVDSVWTQMNISGGTLDVTGSIAVGYSSPGEVDQSGGTVNIGLYLYVSPDAVDGYPGFSQYTLSGSGHLTTDVAYVGYFGSASFIQTGGTFTPTDLVLDGPSGTIGTYNHSGGTLASTATIINVLVPTASGASVVDEGALYTLNLAATSSIGNNAIQSWAVGWGDGSSDSLSGNPSSTQHTYDNGSNAYTIAATAMGGGKYYASTPVHVLVRDVAATVAPISDQTVATGSTLSISTNFTDPGINETHTATINWGDGTLPTSATITETVGTGYGSISASHVYQVHGNYTPELTITDSGGASASVQFNVTATYVVPTLAVITPTTPATEGQSTIIQLHDYGPETTGITSWTIDWGDGSTPQVVTLPNAISSTDAEWDIPHTYGTAGDYEVSAIATDSSGSLPETDGIVQVIPISPTGLSAAQASPNEIDLCWSADNAADVSSIDIYISTDSTTFTYFDSVTSSNNTYQATGLVPNTSYTFEIAAADATYDESVPSNTASATTAVDPWNVHATGAATVIEGGTYDLYLLMTQAGTGPTFDHWTIDWGDGSSATSTSASVTLTHIFGSGVDASVIYVTASTATGVSTPFQVTATPISLTVTPTAPSSLAATVISPNELHLSWSDSSTVATEYDISEYISGAWVPFDSVSAPQTTYDATGLEAGTTYDFQVTAIDDGESSTAVSTTATTATPPVVTATGSATVAENGTYSLSLSSDSSATVSNTVAGWTVNWGDGNGPIYYAGANLTETFTIPTGYYGLTIVATAQTVAATAASYAVQADPLYVNVVPTAPSDVSAVAISSSGATITWHDNSESDSNILLLRSDDGGATFTQIAKLDAGSGSYNDTTLSANESYSYEVEAVGGLDDETTDAPVSSGAITTEPSTIGLALSDGYFDFNGGTINATWTYTGSDVSQWELEEQDVTLGTNFQLIQTPAAGQQSTTIDNVAAYDTYNFRMRADYTDGLVSDWDQASDTLTPTVTPTVTVIQNPGNTSDDPDLDNVLDIYWSLPSGVGSPSVSIEYKGSSTAGNGWFAMDDGGDPIGDGYHYLNSQQPVELSIIDGQSAQFRVAMNGVDQSGWGYSQPITQLGPVGPSPGVSLSLNANNTIATATWTVGSNDAGIYYPTMVVQPFGGQPVSGSVLFDPDDQDYTYGNTSSVNVQPGDHVFITVDSPQNPNESSPYNFNPDGFGSTDLVVPGAPLPTAPSNLVATLTDPDHVMLHWLDNSNSETAFHIYRSIDPTFHTGVSLIDSPGADENQYADALPSETTTYYYRVYAYSSLAAVSDTVLAGDQILLGESLQHADASQGGLLLQSVQFGGYAVGSQGGRNSDFQSIALDSGSGLYPNQPEWLDTNTNGTIDAAGTLQFYDGTIAPLNPDGTPDGNAEHTWPISYMRSTPNSAAYMQAQPVFKFFGHETGNWEIQGNGIETITGRTYTFGPTTLRQGSGFLYATTTSQQPLPNTIDTGLLTIQWRVSFDGGNSWKVMPIGHSYNRLFVTGAAASGAYETVLWVGSLGAEGLRPAEIGELDPGASGANTQLAEAIFSNEFSSLSLRDAAGYILQYWGKWSVAHQSVLTPAYDVPQFLAGLLRHHDGTCDAWTQFLLATFSIEGVVHAVTCVITPIKPYIGFEVRNMPAQGNPTPVRLFLNHVVVKLGTSLLFDPSYGGEFNGPTQAVNDRVWEALNMYKMVIVKNDSQVSVDPPYVFGKNYLIFTP